MGFLLSESGGQSGAISATRFSNVRITNLEDLRANAHGDLLELQWNETFAQCADLVVVLNNLWATTIGGRTSDTAATLKPGVSWDGFVENRSRLAAVEEGISRARLGRFPAPYDLDVEKQRYRGADDMEAFLVGARATLNAVEPWATEQAAKPWKE